MKKHIVKAFIRWVTAVTNCLLYATNIFPHDYLSEVAGAAVGLVEALEGEK